MSFALVCIDALGDLTQRAIGALERLQYRLDQAKARCLATNGRSVP